MTNEFDPGVPADAPSRCEGAPDQIRGEWPYDEPMVGFGFFPEKVSLRPVRRRAADDR